MDRSADKAYRIIPRRMSKCIIYGFKLIQIYTDKSNFISCQRMPDRLYFLHHATAVQKSRQHIGNAGQPPFFIQAHKLPVPVIIFKCYGQEHIGLNEASGRHFPLIIMNHTVSEITPVLVQKLQKKKLWFITSLGHHRQNMTAVKGYHRHSAVLMIPYRMNQTCIISRFFDMLIGRAEKTDIMITYYGILRSLIDQSFMMSFQIITCPKIDTHIIHGSILVIFSLQKGHRLISQFFVKIIFPFTASTAFF